MKQLRQSKGLYYFVPSQYESDVELQVTFTALSHGQLLSLNNLIDSSRASEYTYQSCKLAIQEIEDKEGNLLPFSSLSPRILAELSLTILQMSSVTQEELDTLQKSVNIKFGKTFKSETWDCTVCKDKRLDKTRNCGFRGELTKDSTFKVHADNQVYTHCPIYDVDADILADAVDSYMMFDENMLPDAGGLYDQTRFFVFASSIVTQKLREEERKEADAKLKTILTRLGCTYDST